MFEPHLREFLRDLHGRIHEAERGGEDQLVAGTRELFDGALGVRAFADVFQERRLDLVAQCLHHLAAADFVLIGPAEIADRADIDETDLQLVGGAGRQAPAASVQRGGCRQRTAVCAWFGLPVHAGGSNGPVAGTPPSRDGINSMANFSDQVRIPCPAMPAPADPMVPRAREMQRPAPRWSPDRAAPSSVATACRSPRPAHAVAGS